MSPLDHAEAHERLADLALEPGGMDRLGPAPTDALGAHVMTCETCRRDVEGWRRTHARLLEARGTGEDRVELAQLAGDEPIVAPPELRGAVLAAARRTAVADRSPGVVPGGIVVPAEAIAPVPAVSRASALHLPVRGRPAIGRLLPLVAVLAIAVVGAGLVVDQAGRLDRAGSQIALLEGMTASLDRILNDPDHTTVDLRTADGTPAGTIAWSSHDLVVLTTALQAPAVDRVYRCWIERDGKRSPVGQMWFAGDTAFWNGTLDEWATTSFERGGTFGVSLEPVSGPVGNPAVLVAELPD
ncbi:MAG TPA: anti-sigma factor [Candidatus Limnocylindrales bacterium]|nr:anti-sigma factor [Candidatus Limnocylindrales bacterium]